MRLIHIGVVAFTLGMWAVFCFADQILKKDGTEIEGRIVSEDDFATVIEVERDGKKIRLPVAKGAIAKVTKGGAATQPTPPATRVAATTPATTQATQPGLSQEERRAKYVADREKDAQEQKQRFAEMQEKKAQLKREAEEARAAYLEKHRAEIEKLEQVIADTKMRGQAAEATLNGLLKDEEGELARIEADYRQDARRINIGGGTAREKNELERRARQARDNKSTEVRRRMQPQIADAREVVNQLLAEMTRAQQELNAIMAKAPKVPR